MCIYLFGYWLEVASHGCPALFYGYGKCGEVYWNKEVPLSRYFMGGSR